MDINNLLLDNMEMYCHGKMNFIVGLCEQLKLPEVFNMNLEKGIGGNTDIPYGVMAEMMIANICDDHHPLYRLKEYFEMKDFEGIFHCPISLNQINDDRFGKVLDSYFDTTSKIMWGTYETDEGKEGVISIDFGHSKQKRQDKKQIKMGLGVANGVIVDAKVLSGNKDDKTYNGKTIEEITRTLERLNTSTDDFHYIADSALFTSENLKKAEGRNLKLITRMPETTLLAKECISEALNYKNEMKKIEIKTAQGKVSEYFIREKECIYEGSKLKCAVCYSKSLKGIKKKTIEKQIQKKEAVQKLSKRYSKRFFACEYDANKEISELIKKDLKKVKYHTISITTHVIEKKKPGRQPKDINRIQTIKQYYLHINMQIDEQKVEKQFEEACTFVLCSNDLNLKAEDILKEYKTQSSVEKKFRQLKSPHFINSLYLDTPQRIEWCYYNIVDIESRTL